MDNVTLLHALAQRHEMVVRAEAYLFQPREAYRMRYSASGGRADLPEYPPPGVYVDYYLAGAPAGELKLEILDARRNVVRTITSAAGGGRAGGAIPAQGRRGGGAPTVLPKREWHNRFTWDLRYSGSPAAASPETGMAGGGGGGPVVVPGSYQLRLTLGEWSQSRPLEVKIDPRVQADGVTLADLQEQLDLSLKVRDAAASARQLAATIADAREKFRADPAKSKPLQALAARVVTSTEVYPQGMLIDQFANVARMIGQADQKPGRDAYLRFDDLMKEMAAIKAELGPGRK
jgi:hypothetical protein